MEHRDHFHLVEGVYLLSHSVGLMTKRAAALVEEAYLEPWKTKGGDAWPQWLALIDEFRAALATCLGGQAACYCPQSNLSSALVKYLLALPCMGSPRRVLMHRNAFPSMGFAVEALKDFGISLDFLPDASDPCDPAIWNTALVDSNDIALITHVHSNTGAMSPVKAIIDICQAKGAGSIVDAAQSAGIVPINVADWSADMVMGSCVKWLCGGPGAGFMWINPAHIPSLTPRDVGWFSHDNPFEFDISSFKYASDAMRFWGGTPAIAPYALALGSLQTMNTIGVEAIWSHNRRLMRRALEAMPQALSDQINLTRNGGTLCLNVPAEELSNTLARLEKKRVQIDHRSTTIRASFHIYTTVDEVDDFSLCLVRSMAQKD